MIKKFIVILLVLFVCSALYAHTTRINRPLRIGSRIIGGTPGSLLFIDLNNKIAEDNANLFWDDTNNRLGIGKNDPAFMLDVDGDIRITNGNNLILRNSKIQIHSHSANELTIESIGVNGNIVSQATDYHSWEDEALNEYVRFDSANMRVGIDTSTPTEKLDINSDSIRLRTPQTPTSASATGDQGQIAWDVNYIYVCSATNTWVRTALVTWSDTFNLLLDDGVSRILLDDGSSVILGR